MVQVYQCDARRGRRVRLATTLSTKRTCDLDFVYHIFFFSSSLLLLLLLFVVVVIVVLFFLALFVVNNNNK